MTNKKNFIVLYKDNGDSCDGIPRFLSEHNTLKEAQNAMHKDILFYCNNNPDNDFERTVDDDNFVQLECTDGDWGCEWYVIKKED